jgi:hypothetical protein
MARVMKHQKLVNPAKRKLSLAQKLHFGTARVRAAAKKLLSGKGKRRKATSHRRVVHSNPIGTIITLGANPGKVGSMTKRRRNTSSKRRVARRNPARRRRVARNPFAVVHHRKRTRRNPRSYVAKRRNIHRRRNPSLSGSGSKVIGIIGGAALTKLVSAMLPASFQTGILKYIGTGVVAFGLGWGTGKVFKSEAVGENVMIGGLTLLGLQVLADFVPGIAAYSGLNVGNVITGSSFYTPQVNAGNSMTRFVVPAATPQMMAAPKGLKGVGRLAVSRSGY